MNQIHPLLARAYSATDAAADAVARVAASLATGDATVDDVAAAVDAYRVADRELANLLALELNVNGRRYTLRRVEA